MVNQVGGLKDWYLSPNAESKLLAYSMYNIFALCL